MTAPHRKVLLAGGVSLLTGLAFLGGWCLPHRGEGTASQTDVQVEELARLRREIRTLREVLDGQPAVPGGVKLTIAQKDVLPSQMPERYADYLNPAHPDCILDRKDLGDGDFMAWHFYGGGRRDGPFTSANTVFLIATDPAAAAAMMDGLDRLDPDLVRRLKANRTGCLLGRKKLEALNLQPKDHLFLTGLSHQGIDLELEVLGQLPGERYEQAGLMNAEYLTESLAAYQRKMGAAHPLAGKSLNLVWLRVPSRAAFERVKRAVEHSPLLSQPRVSCRLADSLPYALLPEGDR
jgi:putative ABC transport system permease protein